MNLQTLLADVSLTDFLEQYFHRLPFCSASAAAWVRPWGRWETVAAILCHPEGDQMVVRDGLQYSGPAPTTAEELQSLMSAGYTILARHAERHHAPLQQLAGAFRADLHAPVDVHLYATPAGHQGFTWHYDAEDVFILQAAGTKQYSLRKNTVHPWPLVETIPQDMNYPREMMPLMRVLLNAGDWLYIPCGYWHKAEALTEPDASDPHQVECAARGEASISVALGVLSPAAISIYDYLRPQLVQSLRWRQRLPSHPSAKFDAASGTNEWVELFHELADDLGRILRHPRTALDYRRWLDQQP